ncbi:transcriptional regulator GutM [Streptococcus cameli]
MGELAIVLTVVMLFQLILSIYQVQYYQNFMGTLVKKYQDTQDYQLISEVNKTLLSSNVVVVIMDKSKIIKEAYSLKGMTIFSKFQPYEQLIGHRLDEKLIPLVESNKKDGRVKAVQALIEKYK